MSFVSPEFAFVALIFFPLFWSLRDYKRFQLGFLALASYLLYLSWSPKAALSLLVLSVFVWLAGNFVNAQAAESRRKSLAMAISVVLSLSLLLVTKYYDFSRQMLIDVLPGVGLQHLLPVADLIAPAGVSFFTFQAVTYLVWRYRAEPQALPLVNVLAFLSFWPTLFAGPILRAESFFAQTGSEDFGFPREVPRAFYLILLGLAEKLVFENWLADTFVDAAFRYPDSLDVLSATAAMWGYSLQIFFDFAGYSLIVTGLALLLGYRIPPNFLQPYLARNLRDFWRGWHISLSSFIRDYIYIPLGGSRAGAIRTQVNIVIAMLVSGIWHGAALTFAVWGALHGIGVVFIHIADKLGLKLPKVLSHLVTLLYVSLAWVFFRSSSFEDAWTFIQAFCVPPHSLELRYFWLLAASVVFFVTSANAQRLEDRGAALIERLWGWRLAVVASVVSYAIIYFGPSGIPGFIYYRF